MNEGPFGELEAERCSLLSNRALCSCSKILSLVLSCEAEMKERIHQEQEDNRQSKTSWSEVHTDNPSTQEAQRDGDQEFKAS